MPRYSLARRPGRPQWYVVWSEGGRSRRRSTGTADREEAEIFLAAFRLSLQEHTDARPGEVGLIAVLESYRDDYAAKLPSATQARIAVDHLTKHFPLATVDDITEEAVEGYITERQKKVSNETISRELSVLRAALNRAVRTKMLKEAPKIQDVPRASPRERVLSRQEAARLLLACRGKRHRHVALFIRLGLYTGARPGAILDLTWDRVDFERRLIHYPLPTRAENRKRRAVVPFDGPLYTALERAKRQARTDWVIEWAGDRTGAIKGAFRRAAARAGLKDVTPGVLRHTAATWARQGGADLFAVGAFLGHSRLSTTQRYAKYGADYLKNVVDAIRKSAQRAPNGQKAGNGQKVEAGK